MAEILAACGLGVGHLACGAVAPRDPAAAAALQGPPRRIHHNCSGKHALGLALCVVQGWPIEGYLDAAHPLQRAMAASVAGALAVAAPAQAIDGCGMPTFHAPLAALAGAFGRLAGGGLGASGARVAAAMRAHPALVAFPGAIDTELMAALPVVAKIGAEGVIAIGCEDGRGLAVKVADGALRALDPAAVWAAGEVLGLPIDAAPRSPRWHSPPCTTRAGPSSGASPWPRPPSGRRRCRPRGRARTARPTTFSAESDPACRRVASAS